MFLVKKFLAPLLFPLPLSLGLLLLGVLLLYSRRRQRLGRAVVTAGLALLAFFSLPFFGSRGLSALERDLETYAPAPGRPVQWVVVLGGGTAVDPRLPATEQLFQSSLVRLVEGIRILHLHPGAKLLLSGGAPFQSTRTEAGMMREAALSLGVDPARITLEEESVDTETEAVAVKGIVRDDPFVMVTAGLHLPRALALFRTQGLSPIPAPADRRVKRSGRRQRDLRLLYPNAGNLGASTTVIEERLGMAWARLRGKAR